MKFGGRWGEDGGGKREVGGGCDQYTSYKCMELLKNKNKFF